MKYSLILILVFLNFRCLSENSTNTGEILQIDAKIVYIEPFPFATELSGDLNFYFKQPAWIKILDSNDSIAVLFGENICMGGDVSKKVEIDKTYKFFLKRYPPKKSDYKEGKTGNSFIDSLPMHSVIDSSNMVISGEYLNSLPLHSIIDSSKMVISEQYWEVLNMEDL